MKKSRDTRHIAYAFVSAIVESDIVVESISSLKLVQHIIAERPEMLRAMSETALPKEKRIEFIQQLMPVSSHCKNLLLLLIEKDCIYEWSTVVEIIFTRLAKLKLYHEVSISSVIPLQADEKKSISDILQKKLGGEIVLIEKINHELIAGATLEYSGMRVDGSVKGKLQRLHEHLITT